MKRNAILLTSVFCLILASCSKADLTELNQETILMPQVTEIQTVQPTVKHPQAHLSLACPNTYL